MNRQSQINRLNKLYNEYVKIIVGNYDHSEPSMTCGEYFVDRNVGTSRRFKIVCPPHSHVGHMETAKIEPKDYKET